MNKVTYSIIINSSIALYFGIADFADIDVHDGGHFGLLVILNLL